MNANNKFGGNRAADNGQPLSNSLGVTSMFTISGYESVKPCLLCNAQNGTFSVTCQRNEINGAICSKCLTKLMKNRNERLIEEKPIENHFGNGV